MSIVVFLKTPCNFQGFENKSPSTKTKQICFRDVPALRIAVTTKTSFVEDSKGSWKQTPTRGPEDTKSQEKGPPNSIINANCWLPFLNLNLRPFGKGFPYNHHHLGRFPQKQKKRIMAFMQWKFAYTRIMAFYWLVISVPKIRSGRIVRLKLWKVDQLPRCRVANPREERKTSKNPGDFQDNYGGSRKKLLI